MKVYFILLITMGISCNALAQGHDDSLIGTRIWKAPPLPMDNGRITYSGDISLGTEYTPKRLYANAAEWIRYNLSPNGLDVNIDSANNTVSGTGTITYEQRVLKTAHTQQIIFSYLVRTRPGGYSYRITDINGSGNGSRIDYTAMYNEDQKPIKGSEKWTSQQRYELLSDLHSYLTLMISGLQKAMLK